MIKVRVPASSANLGPGFDTLGLALELYLEASLETAESGISISFEGRQHEAPGGHEENMVLAAIKKVFACAGKRLPGLRLYINSDIPVGKGLGSSAAALVAGMYLANRLLADRFSDSQLIKWAADMEGHPDNVVPAVAGGLTTVMLHRENIYYQKIELGKTGITAVVAVPDFILPTKKSRAILPEMVNHHDSIGNLQKACFLLASIFNRDYSHTGIAMNDVIYQPLRQQFIPGLEQAIKGACGAGAIGAALSGSGPSVLALAGDKEIQIGQAMQEAFAACSIECRVLYLKPAHFGAVYL